HLGLEIGSHPESQKLQDLIVIVLGGSLKSLLNGFCDLVQTKFGKLPISLHYLNHTPKLLSRFHVSPSPRFWKRRTTIITDPIRKHNIYGSLFYQPIYIGQQFNYIKMPAHSPY